MQILTSVSLSQGEYLVRRRTAPGNGHRQATAELCHALRGPGFRNVVQVGRATVVLLLVVHFAPLQTLMTWLMITIEVPMH